MAITVTKPVKGIIPEVGADKLKTGDTFMYGPARKLVLVADNTVVEIETGTTWSRVKGLSFLDVEYVDLDITVRPK
jgi:hypothetical protein